MQSENCILCPHKCNVNRAERRGRCGVSGENIRVGRASLHLWEEPCISGKNGSGTVFFSGCNLGCVYCQNAELSQKYAGKDITVEQLANTMLALQEKGAHNINLVTPTHYSAQICSAIHIAKSKGLHIPLVYNTSGYETVEAIRSLKGLISVYLTDFKYADDVLAMRYSKVSDYFGVAFEALNEMFLQVGAPKFDDKGMMLSGVIVRHLVLPGQLQNTKDVLKTVYDKFGDKVVFSIMNQYTPIGKLPYQELNRKLQPQEYDEVIDYALSIGITNAFIQEEGTQQESYIPVFNGEGICG